nr:hypothetical protein [Tanacetum cinerariifolium]
MVAILEKGEFNTDFHPMVDFFAASPLRYALTVKPTIFVSHIRQFWSTARIETTDEGTYILATVDECQQQDFQILNVSKVYDDMSKDGIVPLFDNMLVHQGDGSGTPTEPHHTPTPEANTSHLTTLSIPLPSLSTAPIPPVTQTNTTPIRQYSRRARIAQSSALPIVADEPASPVRDVSEGEACPTKSGFIADQDRATIAKSSTLPHDSAPRAQEEEILRLKERVQVLEDRDRVAAKHSGDNAPIKGRSINVGQGEACPTDSGFIADQDRETIAKSSTLPHDSAPRVTFHAAEEGSMQQTLNELTDFCTNLQRKHLELPAKFQAQEVEINRLKERVKYLEDKEGVIGDKFG